MIRAIGVVGCIVPLFVGCAEAADCAVDHYNFVFGNDVQAHMRVKNGTICTSGFNIRGGGISSMQVSRPAQHGTAAVAGHHRWGYKPSPGYIGPDAFVVEISGETMGRRVFSGTTNISVDVDVLQ